MKQFFAILAKELLGFIRSFGLVFIVIYFFTVEVYVAGEGVNIEAKNVAVGIVDKSAGGLSKKIVTNLHEPEFKEAIYYKSQKQLSDAIFNKEIMVGLIFDEDFEKNYYNKHNPYINILVDSTTASQSFMAIAYLQNILFDFNKVSMPLELKLHKLFNENADTKLFMSLSELLSVITLLTVILSAVVFVKEKESGTWDIMLLMPADPKLIIIAKSLSQIIIIMFGVVLSIGFVLFGIFDLPINGNIWHFFLLTFLYVATTTGLGLFIASISTTVIQIAHSASCGGSTDTDD